MSNVEKFEELLRSDDALQKKLATAVEAFTGDKGDEKSVFEAAVAPIAAEAGLPITFEEVVEASTNRELDDSELDAVAGGDGFCFIIGGTTDVEAKCDSMTGQACAYIGVTG